MPRKLSLASVDIVHAALPVTPVAPSESEYFIRKDGIAYAGTHLLLELWEARALDDPTLCERSLCAAARAAKATILHSHFHKFDRGGGVSGVVVLAESHISIHTWPERGYAAIDIFMCGSCNPYDAISTLKRDFSPGRIQITEAKRGIVL